MIRSFKGQLPRIHPSCYVDPSAQLIGAVDLAEHVSIWMNAVLRGDVHHIHIGARSNVQDGAVLHGMRNLYPVTLGEMVTVGHNATVHGCTIADAVLVGMGSVLLNHARIGSGSIIAAGAVVPEHTVIPPRSLVAGVPARIKRRLDDGEVDRILEYARNYLDYAASYLEDQAPADLSERN